MLFFYEVTMHPKLLVSRERKNKIFCIHRHKSTSSTQLHFHSNVELLSVNAGNVDVWINGKYRRLGAGDIAVSLSYDAHRYEPVGVANTSYVIVPASMCQELSGKSAYDPFICDKELYHSVDMLTELVADNKNELLTNGAVSVIFGLIIEHIRFTERDGSVGADGTSQVLLYLHDNFKSNITLQSVSAALGYNPSYLSRMFHETTGITFNSYLTVIRLREAVKLLKEGKKVSFCAYESGFNSARTFYRAFSDEFSCTPKEYLKSQL